MKIKNKLDVPCKWDPNHFFKKSIDFLNNLYLFQIQKSKRHRVHSLPNLKTIKKLPYISLSGSDQSKSHNSPVSCISVGLTIFLIHSKLFNSGLSPPCIQNIFSSMIAATGRLLKQSVKIFHSLTLKLLLPFKYNYLNDNLDILFKFFTFISKFLLKFI